tara:strand:+ start:2909 stop:4087 length:1179 start_codon:yes stop_codon:yes gene_type:complete
MLIVYNFIYILLLPVLIIRDLFILKKNKLRTVFQKLGFFLTSSEKSTIWLHGVSLGEIKIISPLAKKLIASGNRVLISTTTNTGRREINQSFKESDIESITFPYDLGFVHKRIIQQYKVKKIVLFESEFWPNLLGSISKDIKVLSLNTSISDKTFMRLKSFKTIADKMIKRIDLFLAQSQNTFDRLRFFGAKNIQLLGNIKINKENYEVNQRKKEKFASNLNNLSTYTIVLGSSHDQEEDFVVRAWKQLPDSMLIIAPRHPERIDSVKKKFGSISNVEIFDQVGDLFHLYAIADLAIVAGSIVFNKGHNFMEPVYADTPSITGSKLDNYRELKKQLCDTKIFETFSTEQDLNYLINKYKDRHYRTNKLNEQKEALAKIAGSYDSVITALNEL